MGVVRVGAQEFSYEDGDQVGWIYALKDAMAYRRELVDDRARSAASTTPPPVAATASAAPTSPRPTLA